jgi:hypothetical protein
MLGFAKRVAATAGAALVLAAALPAAAQDEERLAPRYTYIGAGWEGGDSRCAVEPDGEGVSGYTVEASLGVFRWLHLLGSYFDGETDGSDLDGKCYTVGAGLSWGFADGADLVLRGSYVDVDTDFGDLDGFEPELLVRYRITERTEVDLGMAYYDLDGDDGFEVDNTEIRAGLVFNLWPWLALRAGGSLFDNDSVINFGVRGYFGSELF